LYELTDPEKRYDSNSRPLQREAFFATIVGIANRSIGSISELASRLCFSCRDPKENTFDDRIGWVVFAGKKRPQHEATEAILGLCRCDPARRSKSQNVIFFARYQPRPCKPEAELRDSRCTSSVPTFFALELTSWKIGGAGNGGRRLCRRTPRCFPFDTKLRAKGEREAKFVAT
jgi:hypothetical protein